MTRREFLSTVPAAAVVPAVVSRSALVVPVHQILNSHANLRPEQISGFWSKMWPEAVRDFGSCGIRFDSTVRTAEVRRSPGDRPIFTGLDRSVLNFVITDQIPMVWDSGRALSGVTTMFEGYPLCMVALNYAHCHQIPFLSVNTCVHEILHALMLDIFESRPDGFMGQAREFRIDCYATGLWLFHEGAAIRKSAHTYVDRLRAEVASRG
jgi:hypothetical protein